jgi:hypothetical protein
MPRSADRRFFKHRAAAGRSLQLAAWSTATTASALAPVVRATLLPASALAPVVRATLLPVSALTILAAPLTGVTGILTLPRAQVAVVIPVEPIDHTFVPIFVPLIAGLAGRVPLGLVELAVAVGVELLQNMCLFSSLPFLRTKFAIPIFVEFFEQPVPFFSSVAIRLLSIAMRLAGRVPLGLVELAIPVGIKLLQDVCLLRGLPFLRTKLSVTIGIKLFEQPCAFRFPVPS